MGRKSRMISRYGTSPFAARGRYFRWMAALSFLTVPSPSTAAVTLQGLFSDHMVVQRDMPVPIFGAAAANEAITVKLGAVQAEGKAGVDGRFLIRLPSQPAGGPFELTVNTLVIKDVYVGEVWLASGQSNMDYRIDCKLGWSTCGTPLKDMAKEISDANNPLIRMITINRKGSATPQTTMTTQKWAVGIKEAIKPFSAVGYFFAREVQNSLPGVAVGIVHASFGASCIECWMSKESLAGIPSFAPLLAAYEKSPNHGDQHNPYNCYNGQIHPLKPYAVRGAIWYQGESLTRGEATYRDLQVELAQSWRREWGQDMTFLIAQLANHNKDTRPLLREAQMQGAQMLPNAGLAVTIDIGEATNIHPVNKQDVGLRLGLAARAIAYKQPIHYSGPLYDRMAVEGSSIRLFFRHAGGGLLLKGTGNDTSFQIAGADGRFVKAMAMIDRDTTLLVSSTAVPAPEHARYAFSFNPTATLYSKALPNLPASPFRTNGPAVVPVPTAIRLRAARGPAAGIQAFRVGIFDVRGRKWTITSGSEAAR